MKKTSIFPALAGLLLAAQCGAAWAAPVLLATAQPDVDGDGTPELAELRGEPAGSGYYTNLTLRVLDADGGMRTLLVPDMDGSYGSLLTCVTSAVLTPPAGAEGLTVATRTEKSAEAAGDSAVTEPAPKTEETTKDKTEPAKDAASALKGAGKPAASPAASAKAAKKPHHLLLLGAAQGVPGGPLAFRMYDVSDKDKPQTVWGADMGKGLTAVASYLPERRYQLEYRLHGEKAVTQGAVPQEPDNLKVYDAAGGLAKGWLRPRVTALTSLSVEPGTVYTRQAVLDADGRTQLGTLEASWQYAQDHWEAVSVHVHDSDPDEERKLAQAGVNVPARKAGYRVVPMGYTLLQRGTERETTYPYVLLDAQPELQNKINDQLVDWVDAAAPGSELAYRVEFAGPQLLSLRLYRQHRGDVERRAVNFALETGKDLTVRDMFTVENKDFLPLLNLIGKPGNSATQLPTGWYYNGTQFVFEFPAAAEAGTVAPNAKKGTARGEGASAAPDAPEHAEPETVVVTATDLFQFVRDKRLAAE